MTFAFGSLHWTPDAFWNATYLEVTSAYVGHCQANGVGRWAVVSKSGLTGAQIEEHIEAVAALQTLYPDDPPPPAHKIGPKKARRDA